MEAELKEILLAEAEKKTSKNSKLQINLAINYGSKIEIINALKLINKSKLTCKTITCKLKPILNN